MTSIHEQFDAPYNFDKKIEPLEHLLNVTFLHHLQNIRQYGIATQGLHELQFLPVESLEEYNFFTSYINKPGNKRQKPQGATPPLSKPAAAERTNKQSVTSPKTVPAQTSPTKAPPAAKEHPVDQAVDKDQSPENRIQERIQEPLETPLPNIQLPELHHLKLFPRKIQFDRLIEVDTNQYGVQLRQTPLPSSLNKKSPYWVMTTFIQPTTPLASFLSSITTAAVEHLKRPMVLLHLTAPEAFGFLAAHTLDGASHIFFTAPRKDEEYCRKLLKKIPGFADLSDSVNGMSLLGNLNEVPLFFIPIDERSPHDVATKKLIWNFLKSVKVQ